MAYTRFLRGLVCLEVIRSIACSRLLQFFGPRAEGYSCKDVDDAKPQYKSKHTDDCQCLPFTEHGFSYKKVVFCGKVQVVEMEHFNVGEVMKAEACKDVKPRCDVAERLPPIGGAPWKDWRRKVVGIDGTCERLHYDVLVLGGGPAGTEAAIEAAARNKTVGLIEPMDVFGVPSGAFSKAVRNVAMELADSTFNGKAEPLTDQVGKVRFGKVSKHIETIYAHAREMVGRRLEIAGVNVIKGYGEFMDDRTLKVDKCNYTSDVIFLTTGSKAWRPKEAPDADDDEYKELVYDSDSVINIDRIPLTIAIQGGGIIALEYAAFFGMLGSKVDVLIRGGKDLPFLDKDVTDTLWQTLARGENVQIREKTEVAKVTKTEDGTLALTMKDGSTTNYEAMLIAAGRRGNVKGIGLDRTSVRVEKDMVVVNRDTFHTGAGNIYALGDIANGNFASSAALHAQTAVRNALGCSKAGSRECFPKWDHPLAPTCIWSVPETGSIGFTEQEAKKQNMSYGVVYGHYNETTRGVLEGSDLGFVKIVYSSRICTKCSGARDHPIIGVHCFGDYASDLIEHGAFLLRWDYTVEELQHVNFAAVTWHEVFRIAAYKLHA